jgi:hypothetical protein
MFKKAKDTSNEGSKTVNSKLYKRFDGSAIN